MYVIKFEKSLSLIVVCLSLHFYIPLSDCGLANTLLRIDVKDVGFFTYMANLTLLVCIPVILGMYLICTSLLNSNFLFFADTPEVLLAVYSKFSPGSA